MIRGARRSLALAAVVVATLAVAAPAQAADTFAPISGSGSTWGQGTAP